MKALPKKMLQYVSVEPLFSLANSVVDFELLQAIPL